jgi:hypothetical protein
VALLGLLLGVSSAAHAGDLVKNGGFEMVTPGNHGISQFGYTGGDSAAITTVADWTTGGYNFIYAPGTADTTGSYTPQFDGYLELWGPNNGSANGLPATSPDGGNFVAADGAYEVSPIEQTVTGLTVGQQYTLGFYWAGAQQLGFDGPTTEQWQVSLGGETFSTPVLNNASHGFTGWQYQTFNYTATAPSEVLSFLAVGTPSGVPPFSLLDGVSLNAAAVPESQYGFAVLTGLAAGTMLLGRLRRRARQS